MSITAEGNTLKTKIIDVGILTCFLLKLENWKRLIRESE